MSKKEPYYVRVRIVYRGRWGALKAWLRGEEPLAAVKTRKGRWRSPSETESPGLAAAWTEEDQDAVERYHVQLRTVHE